MANVMTKSCNRHTQNVCCTNAQLRLMQGKLLHHLRCHVGYPDAVFKSCVGGVRVKVAGGAELLKSAQSLKLWGVDDGKGKHGQLDVFMNAVFDNFALSCCRDWNNWVARVHVCVLSLGSVRLRAGSLHLI